MIIDAHVHLPSEGWPKHTDAFATVADAIAYLHAAGTSFALFTPWQGVLAETPQDLDTANSAALALTERYPEFLCPGVSLHPEYPELSRQWLARFRNRGFRWVGELVSYHRPYRYLDDAFVSLCAECAAQGHIVQLHTHADIAELAARLPELRIVCSHIDAELCRKLADRPNVWLDISGFNGGICIGAIETAVATLGVDRLLYGTDFTSYEPRAFQVRLAAAVADSDARERILWRNAARLLALAGFTVPGVPRTTADA